MDVLGTIVEAKRAELMRAKRRLPAGTLAQLVRDIEPPRPFAKALQGPGPRIIAEVKRASPSAGVLRPKQQPIAWRAAELARAYEDAGAAALSVLTDVPFFWGSPDALGACREATRLPALRKDFILDPYQVDESRWLGADAILLIARILDDATLQRCAARARELGMDVLVEVHADDELPRALAIDGALVGVNHRDLGTMKMDPERALTLAPRVPKGRTVVAESGLKTAQDLERLMRAGIQVFLIGERVAASDDPRAELARLRGG